MVQEILRYNLPGAHCNDQAPWCTDLQVHDYDCGSLGVSLAKRGKSADIPLATFSKVVEVIYDCALDPHRWPDTIGEMAELLQSQQYTLGIDYKRSGETSFLTISAKRNGTYGSMRTNTAV